MERPKLNLNDVGTARERELLDRVCDTEFDRILRREVDISGSPGFQKLWRDATPLAQDAFSAVLFRQGCGPKVL